MKRWFGVITWVYLLVFGAIFVSAFFGVPFFGVVGVVLALPVVLWFIGFIVTILTPKDDWDPSKGPRPDYDDREG